MIYNLVEQSTGRNISQSSEPIEIIASDRVVIETPDNIGIWNPTTLVFEVPSESKRMPKSSFYKKIGLTLFGKVVSASKSDVEIEILLGYIQGLDSIDLDDSELLYGLGLLVSKGVWTGQEKDGVLNA